MRKLFFDTVLYRVCIDISILKLACFDRVYRNNLALSRWLAGLKKLEQERLIESCHRKTKNGGNTSKIYRMLFEPFVFKRIREEQYNCFGQRIDDPRMSDTSWAEGLE
ncbi:hypothetical protein ACTL6P_24680 [Endozoicomonas acroporae]|uniref:hypothetical protein n=1 Tax=Endozoicomonas acroporae TaxID=1701104 RepID=UPI0015E0E1EC|nr:hypothetical protein [Endozoicomonas acroporae]